MEDERKVSGREEQRVVREELVTDICCNNHRLHQTSYLRRVKSFNRLLVVKNSTSAARVSRPSGAGSLVVEPSELLASLEHCSSLFRRASIDRVEGCFGTSTGLVASNWSRASARCVLKGCELTVDRLALLELDFTDVLFAHRSLDGKVSERVVVLQSVISVIWQAGAVIEGRKYSHQRPSCLRP